MMKKYKDEQGSLYEAATAQDIVVQMRNAGRFTQRQSLVEFMQGMARRLHIWDNTKIRTDKCEIFVEDLVAAGYLILVD